jgi:hypothetical protein
MASFNHRVVKGRKKSNISQIFSKVSKFLMNPYMLVELVQDLLFNNDKIGWIMCLLLPVELFLNLFIVFKIKCK